MDTETPVTSGSIPKLIWITLNTITKRVGGSLILVLLLGPSFESRAKKNPRTRREQNRAFQETTGEQGSPDVNPGCRAASKTAGRGLFRGVPCPTTKKEETVRRKAQNKKRSKRRLGPVKNREDRKRPKGMTT